MNYMLLVVFWPLSSVFVKGIIDLKISILYTQLSSRKT